MAPPSSPDRLRAIQGTLFMVFGVGLLITVFALWSNFAGKASTSDRSRIASDTLMHAQRIGKAVPYAMLGDPEAFAQLDESRAQLKRGLGRMATGAGIPAKLESKIAITEKAAATIAEMKSELTGLDKMLRQLDTLTPELVSMSEELLMRKVEAGGTPRELAYLGRMSMLAQRMSLSANDFADPGAARPEIMAQLGRDATTFRSTVDGFLGGSGAMQVEAAVDPELRALLGALKTRFGVYDQLVSSMLASQPKYTAAKGAGQSIYFENEELTTQLTAVQSSLRQQQGGTGDRFWLIAAAALLSAAVAVAIVVFAVRETGPQNGAMAALRVLCLVSGVVILMAVLAQGLGSAETKDSSRQARLASDALMHSQRAARAAPNAIEGNVDAFAQLEESRQLVSRDISLLTRGGVVDGASIAPPSPDIHKMLAAARSKWSGSDNAAGTILKMKPELTGHGKTLRQLSTLSPELLSMTEELLHRGVQRGAPARELAAVSRMAMLTQRLAANAGGMLSSAAIRPEAALQLGRDSTVFRGTIDGLLNGNAAMQLSAVDDPEARALIGQIERNFNTYNARVLSMLDDLPELTAAKGAELTIHHENEEFRKLLASVQSSLDQSRDPAGIWFWLLAVAALLTAAAAGAIGTVMLRDARPGR